jgi:PIN domain nuclease of toxin-antitoxin system
MPMNRQTSLLLLDTHVWIWLMEGSERLSLSMRERIQAGVPDLQLRVSAISVWEVAMLEAKQRIVFDMDCHTWASHALAAPGLSLIPLYPEIAIASTRLPGKLHGDPADRILVATARQQNCTLITADQAILDYAAEGWLQAQPAS